MLNRPLGAPDATSRRTYPFPGFQRELIDQCTDPDITPASLDMRVVRWAFQVTPGVAERQVKRAFDKLTQRNDTLRLRAVEDRGEWRADILPKHATGLICEDLGDLDAATMHAEVAKRATAPIPVTSDALFQMMHLKCGKAGDIILFRAHHLIIDGYGAVRLTEELIRLMVNMPVPGAPVTHAAYVQFLNRELQRNAAEKDAFWKARLLPVGPAPDIGRHRRGLPHVPATQIENCAFVEQAIGKPQMEQVTRQAAEAGLSVFNYVFAAFGELLCETAKADHISIWSGIGRNHTYLKDFIGWDAQMVPLRYDHTPDLPIASRAQTVAEQLQQTIDHMPTNALLPDGEIAAAYAAQNRPFQQFCMHAPNPVGRNQKSAVSSMFSKMSGEGVQMGFYKVRRYDVPRSTGTDYELRLILIEEADGTFARLGGNLPGVTEDDLLDIQHGLHDKLSIPTD